MKKSHRLTVILSTLLILSLGCSAIGQLFGSQSSGKREVSHEPPTLPEPAPTNSAQAMQNVAAIIYDALTAGQDLNPYINGVMTAFGVPPLSQADATLAGTRYDQGLPLMFIPQVA